MDHFWDHFEQKTPHFPHITGKGSRKEVESGVRRAREQTIVGETREQTIVKETRVNNCIISKGANEIFLRPQAALEKLTTGVNNC